MSAYLDDRITTAMAAASVLLVAAAAALWGARGGLAAFAGAAVANLNWAALRWLAGRLRKAAASGVPGAGRTPALLFVLKTGATLLAVWLLVTRFGLHFQGFTVGVSALVLGVTFGSLLGGPTKSAGECPAPDEPGEVPVGTPEEM
ncbi:MAG: hypothetical protein AAF447_10665 [Myxococcota bacterium]